MPRATFRQGAPLLLVRHDEGRHGVVDAVPREAAVGDGRRCEAGPPAAQRRPGAPR